MKRVIYIGASIGGLVGGYIPVLLGDGSFGSMSILGGLIGSFVGIWVAFRVSKEFDL